jgi:thioesterase DpgC
LLATLPPKPDRDRHQQCVADTILKTCRELRTRFMRRHAAQVYDVLTNGRTKYLRLCDLVSAAAERFPGLVPTRCEVEAERQHIHVHKDGHEIDQAIFLDGVLRVPAAGRHLIQAMLLPTTRAHELLPAFRRDARLALASVLVERQNGAAHLTFQNEVYLNAEDEALVADLETAVDVVLLDNDIRVGVLRGGTMSHPRYVGKRVFSAGINLQHLYEGRIGFIDFLITRELGYMSKLVRGLCTGLDDHSPITVQKPWVAVVDSFAIGGGMQLLLVCDWVIASQDVYFSLPASQEGIIPGVANLRLGRFADGRLARQMIFRGEKIHAAEPRAALICDEVVPAEAMDEAVERAVDALASPAVIANRAMLGLAEEPPERFREYMAEFVIQQALRLYSDDVIDKVAAWST